MNKLNVSIEFNIDGEITSARVTRNLGDDDISVICDALLEMLRFSSDRECDSTEYAKQVIEEMCARLGFECLPRILPQKLASNRNASEKPYRKKSLQEVDVVFEGEKMSRWDVATLHGLDLDTIRQRWNKGWSIEDAIRVPKHGKKPR